MKLQLLKSDGIYAELLPGEQIQLTFTLPKNKEDTTPFILYVKGHYHTITNENSGGNESVNSCEETAFSFALFATVMRARGILEAIYFSIKAINTSCRKKKVGITCLSTPKRSYSRSNLYSVLLLLLPKVALSG